ncbi:hypothetical protein LTR28_004222 [Elasticomyces elasticus]|nr:hypothetical protein LTR28_004222 [Elasticomyces elasticus]
MHLQLADIYSPLMPSCDGTPSGTERLWDQYEKEYKQLTEALREFPDLRALHIREPISKNNRLLNELCQRTLNDLPLIHPKLRHVTLFGSQDDLAWLAEMSHLQSISLPSRSGHAPAELGEILGRLPNLVEVTITPAMPPKHSYTSKTVQCHDLPYLFSASVLTCLYPLKSVSIYETDTAICNPDLLNALCDTHAGSLQTLRLASHSRPVEERAETLHRFLRASSISELSIQWPNIDDDIFWSLPETLQTLRMSVTSVSEADEIVFGLLENLPALVRLKEVILVAETDAHGSQVYDERIDLRRLDVPIALSLSVRNEQSIAQSTVATSGSRPGATNGFEFTNDLCSTVSDLHEAHCGRSCTP